MKIRFNNFSNNQKIDIYNPDLGQFTGPLEKFLDEYKFFAENV